MRRTSKTEPVAKLQSEGKPAAPTVPAHPLLGLQQTIGNRHLGQWVQAKIGVGQTDDTFEPAADRVAEQAAGSAGAPNGRPLDPPVRDRMRQSFGVDFSGVRLHDDPQADTLSRDLNALAFTIGPDIFFRKGELDPQTKSGERLLAHELTHTLQQANVTGPGPPRVGERGDAFEQQADANAEQVASGTRQAIAVSPATAPLIQRFESFEHVQLGDTAAGPTPSLILLDCHTRDLPQHAAPVTTWPASWQTFHSTLDAQQRRALTSGLSYGEVVALSGDLYDGFQSLNRAPLREVIELIPRIRSRTTTTQQLEAATGGRYLTLAKENIGHFSNVPAGQRNRDIWRRNHIDAIAAARSGNANVAWGLNATGDHFLTDAFSGGHLRTERAVLHAQGSVGDVQSKILHDLDNQFGVEVTNDRGDGPWIAFGDDHLNDAGNMAGRNLALEAVQLSKQDIADALAQRAAYAVPTPAAVFAAELLIPRTVNMTTDRWTGRQSNPLLPGSPFARSTDYQRVRRGLIGSEAPGIATGLVGDDDRIRDWIKRMEVPALGRQSETDKIRMINTLLSINALSGVVDSTDMDAVVRLLGSVTDAAEMGRLRSIFEPRASSLNDIGLRTRLRLALSRNP